MSKKHCTNKYKYGCYNSSLHIYWINIAITNCRHRDNLKIHRIVKLKRICLIKRIEQLIIWKFINEQNECCINNYKTENIGKSSKQTYTNNFILGNNFGYLIRISISIRFINNISKSISGLNDTQRQQHGNNPVFDSISTLKKNIIIYIMSQHYDSDYVHNTRKF